MSDPRAVVCSGCGRAVDPGEPRGECPRCGADKHTHGVEMAMEQHSEVTVVAHTPEVHHVFDFDDGIVSDDGLMLRKQGPAGSEGVRVERGGSDPRSASADIGDSGTIEDTIAERASRKEHAELRSAQTLVQHLNAVGASWRPATMREGREDGVDCVASGEDGAHLAMQMTTPERTA